MTRAKSSLAVLTIGAVLIAASARSHLTAAPLPIRHFGSAAGSFAHALNHVITLRDSARSTDEIRRKLKAGESGTYIAEILNARDSALARWADRGGAPLTVWIQTEAHVADFGSEYVSRVRQAFDAWGSLDLPIHFEFVEDSASADVHVTWIDHFDEPISGRTHWERDDDWVITDASILLALHHSQGDALGPDAMQAMATHEVGHLLGLDHTSDSLSVMAAKVRVRDLSAADCATVRLLYSIPPGSVARP